MSSQTWDLQILRTDCVRKKSKLQGSDWTGGGGGCEQRLARKDHGAPSGDGNVLYLDHGGGYTGKYICKTH